MANTLSLMTNALRNAVSKQRIRYTENGFNLDLAYICENIIAMGYPAENIEGIYRNRIDDVYQFFEGNHRDHYKIYNLCSERSYDINKFHGRVGVYPFDDHNPPTIELIQNFCDDVDCWLKADSKNVAAVHCKAGKGRTGTMICCYLLHSGFTKTAEDALAYYDEKRTKDRKGVTIPSQRRYVQYYSKLIRNGKPYERRTIQICEIKFSSPLLLHSQSTVHCSISTLQDPSTEDKLETPYVATVDFRKSLNIEINDRCIPLTGDVKIEVYHKIMRKKEKIFHFWFNTYFLCDEVECIDDGDDTKLVYEFSKIELDDAHKDKEHKVFPEDFKVQLILKYVPSRSFLIGGHENNSHNNHHNHYHVKHGQFQLNQNHHKNQLHHDQHNNELSNNFLHTTEINSHNTTTTTTTSIGPIYETLGTPGGGQQQLVPSHPSPQVLHENHHHHHHQQTIKNLQEKHQNQMQLQQNHHKIVDYNMEQRKHHHHHQQQQNHRLLYPRDNSSNDVHIQHTPSVSPDVSRTNSNSSSGSSSSSSSSSSSISSEVSSTVGEDWESEIHPTESKGKTTSMNNVNKTQNTATSSDDDVIIQMTTISSSSVSSGITMSSNNDDDLIRNKSQQIQQKSLSNSMITNTPSSIIGFYNNTKKNNCNNTTTTTTTTATINKNYDLINNLKLTKIDKNYKILNTTTTTTTKTTNSSLSSSSSLMTTKSTAIINNDKMMTTATTNDIVDNRRHSNLPLSLGVKSMLSKNFKGRPRREST